MRHKNLFCFFLVINFCTLLFSVNLQAQTGTVTGVVSDDLDTLIGASVTVGNTGVVTDVNGRYRLELEAGTYDLICRYVGCTAQEEQVTVVAGQTTTLDFKLKPGIGIDEVIIVGTRAEPRTQLETSVPIDIISSKAIKNAPQSNVAQILQYLAPSFHSTPQTISDGTDHIDPATLRGLGPDQVLVLVNGKRRHTSSLVNVNGTVGRGTVGTDLNSIPATAIEKIEILRDGAAAQYGSDAIAGVINVVLKDDANLITATVQGGGTIEGDGEEVQAGANFGFEVGEKGGFVNVSMEFTERASTNRSGNYTGSVFGDSLMVNGEVFSDNNAGQLEAFFAQTPFEEQRVMEIGNSALRNAGVFLNAALPLKGSAELYGNLGFNYRNGRARGFYRFPGATARVVPEIYPFGFSPEIHSTILDNAFTLGLRGQIGQWKADLSQTRGQNSFDFTVKNSNNASLGPASPLQAYAGGFSYAQNTSNVDFSRKFDLGSVPLNVAFGGEFRLENYEIFSGEEASYVDGGYVNSNGGTGSAGIQVFPGFQPGNALAKNRNNTGVYLDLEAEVIEKLLIGLAGRLESYSDFGENFSWKVAARYRILDNLSLRAAYSTGFRAPSLHQIYFNNVSTQFVDGLPVQVGTFNNESNVANAFGIENLKAETSGNLSIGLTAKLLDYISLTADVYQVTIDDRIVLSGRFSSGYENVLDPLGVSAAQFFTNAVNTTTQGLDLVANFRKKVGPGYLGAVLSGNFTQTEIERDGDDVPVIMTSELIAGQNGESTLFNREEISRLEVAQPKSKIILSLSYEIGKFRALIRATRFGEVDYIHPSDGDKRNWVFNTESGLDNPLTGLTPEETDAFYNSRTADELDALGIQTRDQVFSPKIVPDLELSYKAHKQLGLSFGIQNFANVYPDKHTHSANISSGRFVYSRRVMQFGVRGMFLYGKLSLTF